MDHLRQDLLAAVRNARKYPVACCVAILSLAGGLGAMTANLVQLVAAQSAKLVGTGLVLGLGLMWALRQFVRSAGGAGSSFDPQWRAFAAPILILVAIGALATWLPTRRARRINVARLLRW